MSYARHNAWYGGTLSPPTDFGLRVRHFTIRSADQLVHKVRVGMDGYGVPADAPPGGDTGWEHWLGLSDDEIRERFRIDFWSADPVTDGLVHDPAPLKDGLG